MAKGESFFEILNAAIADIAEHGFDKLERIAYWQDRLRRAAEASMTPTDRMRKMLSDAMRALYRANIEKGGILKHHPGVSRFTLERVRPALHAELSRRIAASADLIVLNKKEVVEKTLKRFAGWASSVPAGGSDTVKKPEIKKEIKKGLASLPFEERRVLTDQGHKMISSLNTIIATDGGAIAAIWHSHYHQSGYNFREPHKEREIESKNKPFVVRGNWALTAGLMKLDGAKYTDAMTQPGEEVFCRCYYQYLYNLHDLPAAMITEKGRASIKAAAEAMKA